MTPPRDATLPRLTDGRDGVPRAVSTVLMPFVRGPLPPFAAVDREILAELRDVLVLPCATVGETMRAMYHASRSSLVFCWFGSIRYLPVIVAARLAGRPVVVVAGGYDVASEAGIDYGNMRGGPTRWLGRLLFRLASRVLPYSRAGAAEATANAGVPRAKQRLVYLGLDAHRLGEAVPLERKEPIVLTVGVLNPSSIERKGVMTMLRASTLLPDVTFIVAGHADAEAMARLRTVAGSNVQFTGRVTDAELRTLYRRAKVYCQSSVHEAFGYSVAEAMLFNCIPVVSTRGSLPEVAGPAGLYVEPDDPVALADAIRTALSRRTFESDDPRTHITRTFSRSERAAALRDILEELS